ncbi:hypothetical protein JZ751_007712 [Albula glossodonta]|uniref:Tartrate-resistant acid phosphatase type 5 n=1 Tax=Albula glossodonta TaxID=121402 RepID=A0A8T2P8M6_9TELE|nr:hypothetical protein JZ751_025181 [Albula glossodonta]KAG9345898.1 hypothetical protein JZ751_007712 [Albula glossodonta]
MALPTSPLSILLIALPVILCYPSSFMDLEDNANARNKSSIRFLAVGDWGGLPYPPYITPIEKATSREMGKVADQMGADFVLALGDNFYYKGVDSVNDPRFQDTFEHVFTADSLNIPWYVVAGNHDHAGNVKAQIEYSRHSERWRFPYYYYELNFRVPRTDSTLTILMVDTVLLCGNSDDYEDQKPRGPLNAVDANRQLRWIQQRLEKSKADFLLVAGHYPVWSVSEHGPTECLLKRLRPLLYLKESGVGYVVSGAGNFMEADMTHKNHVPHGSLKFFAGQESTMGGFAHVEVSKKQMDITFIQARGTSLYRTTLPRRDIDTSATPAP